jgi:hypothetical protein
MNIFASYGAYTNSIKSSAFLKIAKSKFSCIFISGRKDFGLLSDVSFLLKAIKHLIYFPKSISE